MKKLKVLCRRRSEQGKQSSYLTAEDPGSFIDLAMAEIHDANLEAQSKLNTQH